MSANIWNPDGKYIVSSAESLATQHYTVTDVDQAVFILTQFHYVVGTGSLTVYINGVYQRAGIDFLETSFNSFTMISHTFAVGDTVSAVGNVEIASGPLNPWGTSTETQYAAEGQTVFTIASAAYVANNGSLRVYINGLLEELGDSYTETASGVVFSEGLQLADEVTFIFNSEIGLNLDSDSIEFKQAGTGAVTRTAQDKMRESVSVKDFGALGDGVTDDTVAIQAAVSYIETTGQNVLIPPGEYLTDPFNLDVQFYGGTGSFYGFDRTRCILKRRTAGAGAFITFGVSTGTIFRSHVGMSGIKVDGGSTTNGPSVEAFSLSRSNFNDCHFSGGTAAFRMYGGVSVSFQNCLFDMANRGIHIQDYDGANANKWPNQTKIIGGEIVDNAEYGVWFDGGIMLLLDGIDIEGNGTTRGVANGGVYVGPNVGVAVTSTSGQSPGITIRNCWIERNKGIAQVYCESGINQIYSSFFFANGVEYVEFDIRVLGGKYTVKDCDFVFVGGKTAQISEGSGIDFGNYIEAQETTTLQVDQDKTCVNTGTVFSVFGGAFPSVYGTETPLIQHGILPTDSANPTIIFGRAYKTGTNPRVFCQAVSSSQLSIYSIDTYNVDSTSFTIRKKQFNGTTISAAASLEGRWLAIGTAA